MEELEFETDKKKLIFPVNRKAGKVLPDVSAQEGSHPFLIVQRLKPMKEYRYCFCAKFPTGNEGHGPRKCSVSIPFQGQ